MQTLVNDKNIMQHVDGLVQTLVNDNGYDKSCTRERFVECNRDGICNSMSCLFVISFCPIREVNETYSGLEGCYDAVTTIHHVEEACGLQ